MRFMMLMYPGFDKALDEIDVPVELFGEMDAFNKRLADAGKMLGGEGLHPSRLGARVSFRNKEKKPVVTDGPFTESKEILGGYWLIEADSLEEAVALASQAPVMGTEMIEIRRVYELSDFPQEIQDAVPFERGLSQDKA